MEAGQLNSIKIGYIIQARMQSTRLPGKILMPLPFNHGKPLLKWITDELKKSKYICKIVVVTSTSPVNDVLEDFCANEQIDIFRGDEENVLSRFIEVLKNNNFDVVVRLTGDNPILDLEILEDTIQQHIKLKKNYTKTEGLPLGMNFEIIDPGALIGLERAKLSREDCEHVTLYLKNHSDNVLFLNVDCPEIRNFRLTVDYPSDYAAVSLLLSCLPEDEAPGSRFVTKIAKERNWIFEINKANIQK